MKRKTIAKELEKIHEKFLSSISDEKVRSLVADNTIITGGCIASMLLGEQVNDYDMYFTNRETVLAVCNYYKLKAEMIASETKTIIPPIEITDEKERIKIKISSSGLIKFPIGHKIYKSNCFLPIFLTSNAITLSDKVQLIIRFFGCAEEIHSNYDFEHCKSYWTSKDGKLVIPGRSAEALLARELLYSGSKYPLSSIIRTRKFIQRGWRITAGEYLKMAIQLNDLDLLDVEVLEDQLIGVDTTYFSMFINRVKEDMKKPNFQITGSYVCMIIDEIFNETEDEFNTEE